MMLEKCNIFNLMGPPREHYRLTLWTLEMSCRVDVNATTYCFQDIRSEMDKISAQNFGFWTLEMALPWWQHQCTINIIMELLFIIKRSQKLS